MWKHSQGMRVVVVTSVLLFYTKMCGQVVVCIIVLNVQKVITKL